MGLESIPNKEIRAVFTDLDDTLTENQGLSSQTYDSLWRLKSAGLRVAIISGRPAGWADCLMRLWPLDAMVFENGAGVMTREGDRILTHRLAENAMTAKTKLASFFQQLKTEIPSLKLATDQPYRLCDMAIDFNEEDPKLSPQEVERLMRRLEETPELNGKLSSIHLNIWCGAHTKVTAVEWLLSKFGLEWGLSKENVVFSGDSPNDEPLFEFFAHTVGVANIQPFLAKMKTHPKSITQGSGGRGFQELVDYLLA